MRDFAELNRISQRTVQIKIKEHFVDLEEHIERRGKQGTWLDDYAQEFLLNCIQLPKDEEVYLPSARETALMEQLQAVTAQLAAAEHKAEANAQAAGRVALLEASNKEQEEKIDNLKAENILLEIEKKALKKDLEEEKNRKLTLKERFFGKKGK